MGQPATLPPRLILLRHGESMWNQENLFTGWVDVPLSAKGIDEAFAAGEFLENFSIDVVFCSGLARALMTAMIALCRHPSGKTPIIQHSGLLAQEQWGKIHSDHARSNVLPVYTDNALNERMYGALQGLNKEETANTYGAEQVHQWRRSYAIAPPGGESLKMTLERTLPYFLSAIEPILKSGQTVLIAAHGNSLRSIIKYVEKLDEAAIVHYELATGIPVTYAFRNGIYTREQM